MIREPNARTFNPRAEVKSSSRLGLGFGCTQEMIAGHWITLKPSDSPGFGRCRHSLRLTAHSLGAFDPPSQLFHSQAAIKRVLR